MNAGCLSVPSPGTLQASLRPDPFGRQSLEIEDWSYPSSAITSRCNYKQAGPSLLCVLNYKVGVVSLAVSTV